MPIAPAVGFVVIWTDDPPAQVTARLGDERPEIEAGYGGWEEVARPRRTTVTSWVGQPARRLSLPILLDHYAANAPVERDIRKLERMALPRHGGEPPTVRFNAKGNHVPGKSLTWVIEGITWGDAIMNPDGERVRQAATLALLEFVSDDLIDARTLSKSAAERRRFLAQRKKARKQEARDKRKAVARSRRSARRRKKKSGSTGGVSAFAAMDATVVEADNVTAFDGEDLMAIAARELGDVRRWREIADLNGIRDPRAVKVGQVLRMP
jgi:hypothetical protein